MYSFLVQSRDRKKVEMARSFNKRSTRRVGVDIITPIYFGHPLLGRFTIVNSNCYPVSNGWTGLYM